MIKQQDGSSTAARTWSLSANRSGRASGVSVAGVTSVGGRLWLPAVLEDLVAQGVTRLLVEGGPQVWRAFAASALVDEVALYVAGDVSDTIARTHLDRYGIAGALTARERRRIGPDTFILFARS